MHLISALGRQRQVDLCEFKSSLVYKASSRIARATQRNPVSKINKQTNKHTHKSINLQKKSHVVSETRSVANSLPGINQAVS